MQKDQQLIDAAQIKYDLSSFLNYKKELHAKWTEKYTNRVDHFDGQLDFIGHENLAFFTDDHCKMWNLE